MKQLDSQAEADLMRPAQGAVTTQNSSVAREVSEVQAMVVMAKQFPRDTAQAANRIKKECERFGLAEKAHYSYPRGGTKVEGPSIRLAECIAHNWGNIEYGTNIISQTETHTFARA